MSDTHDRRRQLAERVQPAHETPTLEQVIADTILCWELRTVRQEGITGALRKRRAWLVSKVIATLGRARYDYVDDVQAGRLVVTFGHDTVKVFVHDEADTGRAA